MSDITLQKPLGTDIYNIGVFNANATIIEEYLNRFSTTILNGLSVSFPKAINLDMLETSINICDGLTLENATGTFPANILGKANFMVTTFGTIGSSRAQFYSDLTYGNNKNFFRSKIKDEDEWSDWSEVGSGSGGDVPGELDKILEQISQVFYMSDGSVDCMNCNPGVYIGHLGKLKIANPSPEEVLNYQPTDFVFISLGKGSNKGQAENNNGVNAQLLIDYTQGNSIDNFYIRYDFYASESGTDISHSSWRQIKLGGSGGGGGDITVSVVTMDY